MIHIGDRHDHHHIATQTNTGGLFKWLAVVAALATGAGGSLGGWMLWNTLANLPQPNPPASAPPIPSSSPDRDTLFELRLGPPSS